MAKIKIRPRRGRVLRSRDNTPMTTSTPEKPKRSQAAQRIMELVHYKHVIDALRKGVSVNTIVKWFEREGWIENLSPSTFTQYLYKFKVECAELVTGNPLEKESYDFFIGTNIPDVDAGSELDKLILLQKRRLSVDVSTEISIGKLLDNTHKEVAVLGDLLKQKAGLTPEAINTNSDSQHLRTMRVNEAERDKLQNMTDILFKGIANATKKTAKAQKKVNARRG